MKRNGLRNGLNAVCAACVITAAGVCSQSAQASNKPTMETAMGFALELTAGRTRSLVGTVVSLISLVIGGLALARTAGRIGTGNGRTGAIVALVLGLIGIVLSVVHLGRSTGGFGTGSGRAGAIVALVLGLIGMNLGGLALARSRRSRSTD